MYRLVNFALCVFALVFAYSGVRKAIAPEAGWFQIAHGLLRVLFGTGLFYINVRALFRRTKSDGEPAETQSTEVSSG